MRFSALTVLLLVAACSASGKGIYYSDGGSEEGGLSLGGNDAGTTGEGGTPRKDGGKSDGATTTSSDVTLKNVTFTGNVASGKFTFVLENGSSKAFETLSEVRIAIGGGTMTFTTACTKFGFGVPLNVAPGDTSPVVTITTTYLDDPSYASVSVACSSTSQSPAGISSGSPATTGDVPTSLTLKGIYDDAAPWTATGEVQ